MSHVFRSLCITLGGIAFVVLGVLTIPAAAQPGPHYSDWSAPVPVSALNTTLTEFPNGISRDALSLYFQRRNNATGEDLYVAHRPDAESDWNPPIKLPATINSNYNDRAAYISADEHWLLFSSDRPGGVGGNDLYISRRTHTDDDMAWEPAVNISVVNSVGFDSGPALYEPDDTNYRLLFFNSAPFPGGLQAVADLYISYWGPEGFRPPALASELNSAYQEGRPYLRSDGLEIYFQSNRQPPNKALWVWGATRDSIRAPWTTPAPIVTPANFIDPTITNVSTPVLSWDGLTLWIGAIRGSDPGDVYVMHRTKVHKEKCFKHPWLCQPWDEEQSQQ